MKNLLASLLLFSWYVHSQETSEKFNLDFEQVQLDNDLPDDWFKWGDYTLDKDSLNAVSGKFSAKITAPNDGNSFGSIAYKIPANYKSGYIQLEGYIKTENIEEGGFAGLLLRVDGASGSLSFDNMDSQNLIGTNDWKKYKIAVRFPENARFIYLGGILVGKGTAWFDNFTLKINGEDIQNLKELPKILKPAEKDSAYAEGSNFKIEKLTTQQQERLYKLGKVWGFLKYHHPEIAKGNVNWDNELFRILPAVNSKDFDAQLTSWVKKLGEVEAGKHSLPKNGDFQHAPDYKWITNGTFLNKQLSNYLQEVLTAKREKENYYVDFNPEVNNPIFIHEKSYQNMAWDDTGIKLLALFRYWNMMEYFNPNNYLINKDWEAVLKEYIPRLVSGDTELSYKLAMLQLIGEVADTHANIWGRDSALLDFFGSKRLPANVQFIEEKPVVTKVSEAIESSGINEGDIIVSINGKPVEELIAENAEYYPASNQPTRLRDMAGKLLWTNQDSLKIGLKSKNYQREVWVKSVDSWNDSDAYIPSHKMIGEDIGYIYPESLKEDEIDDIMEKFMDKQGIILDMRCYPSVFIVFSMGKYLMPKPLDFAKFTNTSIEDPGYFEFREGAKVGIRNGKTYDGKVMILINEETQSQAEYTTMALRVAPNATVIGSTTAGADGNVSRIILPGAIQTMISGIGVYYPDGTETQRVGIIPDIKIQPTIESIRNGEDVLLNKAVEIIEKSSAGATSGNREY